MWVAHALDQPLPTFLSARCDQRARRQRGGAKCEFPSVAGRSARLRRAYLMATSRVLYNREELTMAPAAGCLRLTVYIAHGRAPPVYRINIQ
jgi:hypothetical protein